MLALRSDICRCMEALTRKRPTRSMSGFRTCLGEGVLRHPGEVRTLLKDSPEVGTSGYRLGISIGTLMRSSCPAYQRALARVRTSLEEAKAPTDGDLVGYRPVLSSQTPSHAYSCLQCPGPSFVALRRWSAQWTLWDPVCSPSAASPHRVAPCTRRPIRAGAEKHGQWCDMEPG